MGRTDRFVWARFYNLALPFFVKMRMIHDTAPLNTILTGSVSMVTLHLTAFISQPDISSICQVVITIATIAKFWTDYRDKRKKTNREP